MATINAIQTLIDLSTQQSELEATRLGLANKARTEAQEKLSMLEEYRNEYAERFQQQLAQGLSSGSYINFKQFIATLDQTIIQQQQIVQNSHHRVEKHRADWQESERKRLSYSTLTKRAEIALRHKENKRDQKQTDEHASRVKMRQL